MTEPLVSVIVPTRNNRRTIEACLRSVKAQDHPHVELIVVDNHSTDGTDEIARALADVVITGGPERSAQRNRGIRAAEGVWILWLDSDMYLPPDAVSAAVRTAATTGATGVALPERTIGQGFWTACRALERECYLDAPWLHNPRLLRRSDMVADGFHESMSGPEDADLRFRIRQAGGTVELAPVIVDHDEGRLTLRDIWQKRYYYGLSLPTLVEQHDGAMADQGAGVLRAYARNWRRLLGRPGHALGMAGMRAMEAAGYLWGARAGRRQVQV
ncbi:glycosyltransferase [Aeromicrobium sp. 636]|uniref:4,4'-diaponeurosporenoate glycosyltransferase n=1 Tax=Aeromicrobium senzhongii TaxID=2663859 RepID=A0A8I0ESX9_9ACTN|nr:MULTISPECIES: glycosyltransferase [Aeromicrobium]MBC9224831.1 glycosyltransferase [Aeromicrobium senzhongii]MCQ3996944.1 glycosyltransferase [Aeromicrobium sp. 636]MTB86878.1 glycosyltransferase [Aeromicrobium senzhongii]QNL93287.1 glycosyltransferase [Aeromicrobium senzhongii]